MNKEAVGTLIDGIAPHIDKFSPYIEKKLAQEIQLNTLNIVGEWIAIVFVVFILLFILLGIIGAAIDDFRN